MTATTTSANTTATPAELRLLAEDAECLAELRTDRLLSCARKCRLRFPRRTPRHFRPIHQRKCRNLSPLLLSSYLPTASLACGRLIDR